MTYFQNNSIKYVRGDYAEDSILNKANAHQASYAIILNDTANNIIINTINNNINSNMGSVE